MFIISSNELDAVLEVASKIDNIDNFDYLDLADINTLVLAELASGSINWTVGEPLVLDKSSGVVLVRYSTDSLTWFENNLEVLIAHGVDKNSAVAFFHSEISQLFCLDTL